MKNNLDKEKFKNLLKDLNNKEKEKLIIKFSEFMTESRFEKIIRNSQERTEYATIVLEDIKQPHNVSAALRSAECFGIQDVHVIEKSYKYDVNPSVAKGATDWLTIHRYKDSEINNSQSCFENLRKNGYKIYATTPHTQDQMIYDLPLEEKVALVFGTEIYGISDYAKENVDGFVKIPMHGFTESFNISVSVSICLYDISRRLRNSDISWKMNRKQILDLQLEWLERSTGKLNKILSN